MCLSFVVLISTHMFRLYSLPSQVSHPLFKELAYANSYNTELSLLRVLLHPSRGKVSFGFCFASFAIHLLGVPHSRVNLCYVFTEYFIFPVQCPSPCCVKISKMLPKGFSSARSIYNTEWVFFNHMPLLTSLQTDDIARCSPSSGFISHPHFLIAKVFTPTATQRCPICCRHSRDPFPSCARISPGPPIGSISARPLVFFYSSVGIAYAVCGPQHGKHCWDCPVSGVGRFLLRLAKSLT